MITRQGKLCRVLSVSCKPDLLCDQNRLKDRPLCGLKSSVGTGWTGGAGTAERTVSYCLGVGIALLQVDQTLLW